MSFVPHLTGRLPTQLHPMSDSIIEVHDLHKTYREGLFVRKQVNALRGVSLEVPRGCIFGLLGPNGAGKTTLIKVLLGLVKRSSGGGKLLGRPLGDRVGRMKVGYLPEHHRFPRHLTGDAAMVYYGGLSGLSRREVLHKRPALLERVGLSKWGQTPVHKYSKGMQQRLGIAQALLHNPELLILDEPTDGVDPVGRAEVRRLLKDLQQEGTTIFLNSHQLQEIELVCDQAAILANGRVQKLGTIEEITKHPNARIEFVLQGSLDDMQYALTFAETEPWQTDGDHLARVIVSAEDQSELNRCVDALRDKSINILEMRRLRTTLEDAFLDIVSADTGE
ncbi:ABC transporter ATP-binding protein [Bremerella sp.]|uniref:ABC transporter ATP-binding protein n=1 Tax=Bremerella sp. TaxID=2795602 RepID=UPI003919E1BE